MPKSDGLDPALLRRWMALLAVEPLNSDQTAANAGRPVSVVPLGLLEESVPKDNSHPAIHGWRQKGSDLPVLVTNASSKVEYIPGKAPPHGVAVHPSSH